MPSHAAGSVQACASAVRARGILVRHAVPSRSPSGAGRVAVTDPRSFVAAAANATARPPTWSSMAATGISLGVGAPSWSSSMCRRSSESRRAAGVRSTIAVMGTSLPCRPRARCRVGPGCLPQSRYEATCCLLIAAVRVTQYPGQLGLLDRDPGHQPDQWDDRADRQGEPVADAEAESQGDQQQAGVRGMATHRYGPGVTTAWSASTWMKVLKDRPSVRTAPTRRARPTQITTTPAAATASGAGVSSAGTQLRSRMPIQIDPARVRETITRVPRSGPTRPLRRTRSRTSRLPSHANQQWDGLSSHWSTQMRAFLDSHRDWLTVERLPAYAPELNAVEYLWANLKDLELANLPTTTLAEVADATIQGIQRVCKHRDLAVGFLAHTGLSLDP